MEQESKLPTTQDLLLARSKLSLIVPCYNEEKGVPNLISQLDAAIAQLTKTHKIELILVDDGSSDNTHALLIAHYGNHGSTTIIQHVQNKNLGGALRTGFAAATGDIIVALDADCTFPPSKIAPLVAQLTDDVDIVNASHYHPLGAVDNVPLYRKILTKAVTRTYKTLTGRPDIHTYTGIFRAYRREVIENVTFESHGFLCCAELLVNAISQGYRIKEFPITLHTRQYGESSMQLAHAIIGHAGFITKLVLRGGAKNGKK